MELARALKECSQSGPIVQTLVLEGSPLPVPQLIGICELGQVAAVTVVTAAVLLLSLAAMRRRSYL